ncbi:MAG TPA: glycosyltransferase family 39 protein [Candidatus Levybacteria bacterium]|nr:glycosyltransferase family 39 protein [Candidatus Levybacteria bacterium]
MKILKKNWITLTILIGIFLCALLVRLINLSEFPVGFQIDEASLGYNSYSLFMTGRSESGDLLPLYVNTFGDYNPIGYDYLAIPSIAIFGLTEFATRLPAAIFGSISIFSMYYLAYVLFKNKKISLLSAFLIALSPWHIGLSRGSAETLVALFFVITGFAFILSFFNRYKKSNLIIGVFLLVISFLIYPAPRIFVPVLFVAVAVYYFKSWYLKKKYVFTLSLGFLILIISLSFLIFTIPGGTARFKQTSIFNFPETRLLLEEQIREDGVNGTNNLFTRAYHNKIINFSLTFVSNYMEYFNGSYLFIKGGQPLLFSIPSVGLVYLIELPFLIIGIYVLIKSKEKNSKIPLIWLIIAPIVAAATVDDTPNIRRSLLMVPAIEIIVSVGIISFFNYLKNHGHTFNATKIKYIITCFLIVCFIGNVMYFFHQYFIHAKHHRTWYRNNGFSEMMEIVNEKYEDFDKIVATKSGGGYPLFLFFSKYNPRVYQMEGSPKDVDYKGFGKYIFVPSEYPSIDASTNMKTETSTLYIDRGTCSRPSLESGRKYKEIYREDGSLGFRVVY